MHLIDPEIERRGTAEEMDSSLKAFRFKFKVYVFGSRGVIERE
jgi:hypothetical protein